MNKTLQSTQYWDLHSGCSEDSRQAKSLSHLVVCSIASGLINNAVIPNPCPVKMLAYKTSCLIAESQIGEIPGMDPGE